MTNKQNFLSDVLTGVGYKVRNIRSMRNGCVECVVVNGAKEIAPVYCFADKSANDGMTVKFKIANGVLPTETIRNTRSLDERAVKTLDSVRNGNWNNCVVDVYHSQGYQPENTLRYNSTVLRMRFDEKPW
jgi:hypothetical protein